MSIVKLLKLVNDDEINDDEASIFKYRRVARVVAFDKEGKIALVHAKIKNYYALPGGGVEVNESLKEGAVCEVREEAGCDVKIIDEIGIVKEYLKSKELVNEQFCYLAEVVDKKSSLKLDQYEIEEGMEVIWVDVNDAINLLKTNAHVSHDIVILNELNNL